MKKPIVFLLLFLISLSIAAVRASYVYHTHPSPKSFHKENQLMDRHLLTDTLVYIFGPESSPIVNKNIFELGAPLGGGCDFYKMTYDKEQKVIDPLTRCPAGIKDVNIAIFAKANPLRLAAIDKTCRQLSNDSHLLGHALELSHVDKNAPITMQSFANLYFVFNKAPMSQKEEAHWSQFLHDIHEPTDWPQVAHALCVSPEWQTL